MAESSRECESFDVVIVGAGPAGLSAACRLKQLGVEAGRDISVAVVEKGSEVGAHIISGAVFETRALDELFPDWQARGAPVTIPVQTEEMLYLWDADKAFRLPQWLLPASMRNQGNYIISLGQLCRWLGQQAEALGVEIFPGFAAGQVLFGDGGEVAGVITGDMGVAKDGARKAGYQAGVELRARHTIFAEGCRGHLGKQLLARLSLGADVDPQHYGLGIKEIWRIDPARHAPGLVIHSLGWPLDNHTDGGGFLYHIDDHQVALGVVVALNYRNPYLNPFEEMQRWKQHPRIRYFLEGGTRLSYGARALNKGGFQSVPRLGFPGGVLAGCEAGFLNNVKLKGCHTAMKTGMLAAEAVFAAQEQGAKTIPDMDRRYRESWVYRELYAARNFNPLLQRFGTRLGSVLIGLDQLLFRGHTPVTLHNRQPDFAVLRKASDSRKPDYPRPDGVISFDRLSSVYLSNTNHEEDQPCHLVLADPAVPIEHNLPLYDEPAQCYCPAAVYEVVKAADGSPRFQINAQNCVHCKTCDIKDPAQNITWEAPEGGGGPNYSNM